MSRHYSPAHNIKVIYSRQRWPIFYRAFSFQYGTTGGTGDLSYKHLQATQLLLHTLVPIVRKQEISTK